MRVFICDDYNEMSKKAANMVAGQIFIKPDSVIGLATGSTPLQMYKELIKMYEEENLDFRDVTTFNLDEYIGLKKDDVNSYNYYMMENFFKHINIRMNNVYIPDGKAPDIDIECEQYEEKIEEKGGIDLQVLGIGNNGHIGFNEPDLKFEATTHLVKLDEMTIEANSRFFSSIEEVPKHAISMGIKTIMHSRKIVLLANGMNKAETVYKAMFGPITPEVPASILQLHPDANIFLEKEAAEKVKDIVKKGLYR